MLPFIFVIIIKTVDTNVGAFETKNTDIFPNDECKFPDLKTIKVN